MQETCAKFASGWSGCASCMVADLACFEGLHQAVLVLAAQLPQNHNHLDVRDVLVASAVIAQCGPGKHITPNGDACDPPRPVMA